MTTTTTRHSAWLDEADADLADLVRVTDVSTDPADYPHADRVESEVLVYDSARLRAAAVPPAGRRAVQAELVHALMEGPGLVVLRGRVPRPDRCGPGHGGVQGDDRRTAVGRQDGRRPLREARSERPRVERAGEAGGA